jgi:hypothetical protein
MKEISRDQPKPEIPEEQRNMKMIRRIFLLEEKDYNVINKLAVKMGFGGKGHSGVVRYIIRDWLKLKKQLNEDRFLD